MLKVLVSDKVPFTLICCLRLVKNDRYHLMIAGWTLRSFHLLIKICGCNILKAELSYNGVLCIPVALISKLKGI